MAAKWYELITGSLDDKKAYRQYKARIAALPEPYGTAAKAFERYFMYNGGITDGDSAVMITMLNDFADLWERAAVDGTPVEDDRRRRPGRVRRGVRRGVRRQALDRQGAQPPHRDHREPRREGRAMTTDRHRHPGTGHREVVQGPARAAGRRLRREGGQHLRPPRLERRRQDHARAHPVDAAEGRRRHRDASTASTSPTKPGDVRESISLTGQFAAVDEVLTGRENLVLVAKLRHLKNPGAIADDLLARFALTEAGGRKAGTYSGGMRRRLDIAMSLIGNPPIIFLDEPTTGLDPQARIEVWQTVKKLADGRHDRAADHAVPRRGRAARRPHRDPAQGHDHPERHPRRTQAAAAGRQGRVRREAALPRGRLPHPRRRHRRDRNRRRPCRRRRLPAGKELR